MNRTATTRRGSRAFTLVEMVTSLVILSVLLLACGSSVMMASRATTGAGAARAMAQIQTADAATQLADDLNVALTFTQRTPTAVAFTVPDRLGLGTPQPVVYSWTGVAGDPLVRQFNGGTATPVLAGVQSLNLSYLTRLMGPTPAPAPLVVFAHDAVVGSAKDNNLDNKNFASQYFVPSLPSGATSYTLTRIRLVLKAGDQSAVLNVSLQSPDALLRPTGTVIAQTTVNEAALSNQYEWVDVPITGATNLSPLQGLCVVLSNTGTAANTGATQVDQSLVNILSTADWSTSTNAGSTWSAGLGTTCARMYVYATVP